MNVSNANEKFFELDSTFPGWVLDSDLDSEMNMSNDKLEIHLVRRWLSRDFARGSLPILGVDRSNDLVEERERLLRYEELLRNQFEASLNELYFSPNSFEGWFRAGQCLIANADAIVDRIEFATEAYKSMDILYEPNTVNIPSILITNIHAHHVQEQQNWRNNDISSYFKDLEFCIRHPWATFSSLISFVDDLKKFSKDDRMSDDKIDSVLNDLDQLYSDKNFATWQTNLGSIKVAALRKIAHRCFRTALCLAKSVVDKQDIFDPDTTALVAEMSEIVGTHFYRELLRATVYGTSILPMSDGVKICLANKAQLCFEFAIDLNRKLEDVPLWELTFMVGKVSLILK